MEPIVMVYCDDCGPSMILDPSFLSIIQIDEEFIGATICFHCERPLVYGMPQELSVKLHKKGVKVLKW